jgi:hypothetical protein
MRSIILAVFLTLCFSGCFHQGRNFDISPVKKIRNDVTTQREIYADFGEPLRRGVENGLETWVYSYP